MNKRHTFLATVIAAMLVSGMIVGLNVLSSKTALARSDTSDTANHFGKAASDLAKGESSLLPGEQMGKHSASTQGGGDIPVGKRAGVGNIGQEVLGCDQKLKPGQVADALSNGCP